MPKTLLLADDSVTIQRVIELTFAHEDVRVVSVSDGRRAVQWMESEWPDIVLVDVEVPEVDGYAIATHVKNSPRLKNVPVLLLAGAFEPVDDERAKACGCDGVLVKPFEPKQLVARVKELLARSSPSFGGAGKSDHDRDSSSKSHEGMGATITPFPAAVGRTFEAPGGIALARAAHADMEFETADPEPLEPPVRPVWDDHALGSTAPQRPPEPPAAVPSKVSLVSAFSALLAAEQSNQPAPAPVAVAQVSDASVEDAVRRVLTRMTDDLVRRIVIETAERLIKEEIEKIKANPE